MSSPTGNGFHPTGDDGPATDPAPTDPAPTNPAPANPDRLTAADEWPSDSDEVSEWPGLERLAGETPQADLPPVSPVKGSVRNRIIRRLVVPLAILACLAGLVWVATAADTDGTDLAVANNDGLDGLIPTRNAEILSQDVVGVDLALGWTGSLSVNGIDIPESQLVSEPARNWLFFRPGPDQVLKQLDQSTNCAEIRFWRTTETPAQARAPVRWCFQVT